MWRIRGGEEEYVKEVERKPNKEHGMWWSLCGSTEMVMKKGIEKSLRKEEN